MAPPLKYTPLRMTKEQPGLGPLLIDIEGLFLTKEDQQRLTHPWIGGVILFSRNYQDPVQLLELIQELHALRSPRLLITIDQEGGRVQRLTEGFTRLPCARAYNDLYQSEPTSALKLTENAGWLMATELGTLGIDMSFAPVLDVKLADSEVIGDRSFGDNPQHLTELAAAFINGMNRAGMKATGKHFPGHGGVKEDSHLCQPVDKRSLEQLKQLDLVPFKQLAKKKLAAIMTAHITYPNIDPHPATFSPYWLQKILRDEMGFGGVVFSDDLSMQGANTEADITQRVNRALTAGCDMVLICNDTAAVDEVLLNPVTIQPTDIQQKIEKLYFKEPKNQDTAHISKASKAIANQLAEIIS